MPTPMKDGDSERLDELRERLYARSADNAPLRRTKLSPSAPTPVASDWDVPKKNAVPVPSQHAAPAQSSNILDPKFLSKYMPRQNGFHSYRIKVLLAGVVFFVIALVLSSLFLVLGNNTISGENIELTVTGPFAVGGGAELQMQIAVANKNAIPVESATLIIEYPPGTQSADGTGKELFIDRQTLDSIEPGQILNIPASAIIFGEENTEKEINVSVEYRVRGSNATFYREAEPLRFKVSSSPVVLLVDSVQSITSGQEVVIHLKVASNSPTPLENVLVEATYPFGFDFSSSKPDPNAGRNVWRISKLEPEETVEIEIKGIVTGKENDERVFDFAVGVPSERDPFTLASEFTKASAEIAIEDPFLGVDVVINGNDDDVVVVGSGESANVRISFRNTQEETLYDGKIEVKLGGSALSKISVNPDGGGYYNSGSNMIVWDGTDESSLKEIAPGRTSAVSFTLTPNGDVSRTPEISIAVTARSNRVFEDRVPEELVSTASRTLRISSTASLTSSVAHDETSFNNEGPLPPVADETTEYTFTFSLKNGSNDLVDGEMTAILPQYVTWLGNVSSGDDVTYNNSTRTLTWDIGNVDANTTAEAQVQIAVTPSLSHVGKIPTIIETQRFRATDRFTGATVRSEAAALTTAIPGDSGKVEAN